MRFSSIVSFFVISLRVWPMRISGLPVFGVLYGVCFRSPSCLCRRADSPPPRGCNALPDTTDVPVSPEPTLLLLEGCDLSPGAADVPVLQVLTPSLQRGCVASSGVADGPVSPMLTLIRQGGHVASPGVVAVQMLPLPTPLILGDSGESLGVG